MRVRIAPTPLNYLNILDKFNRMRKIGLLILVSVIVMTLSITVVSAKLGMIRQTERDMFKNMVKNYLSPAINGWGIGLNTASDTYSAVKFHVVSVKILPRVDIADILKQAKSENVSDWSVVKDRLNAALNANGTVMSKGRIQVNKEKYILTNIVKTETTVSADIRNMPNYETCKTQNVSAENCETNSTKVGDFSLARKTAEFEQGKDRVWAGTLNFNSTAYTFVALVNPRSTS